VNCAQAVHCV